MHGCSRILGLFALVGVVAVLTLGAPTQSYASNEDVYRENTDISRMFHKMGRGIVNVLTGWVEIPKNIAKQWRETDPFTGFVLGTLKGIGWGFGRTIAGVYEVVTFPFPIPRDYAPVMQPEFILPSVWGESLPLFREDYKAASGLTSTGPSGGSRYTTASGPMYGKDSALSTAERSGAGP